MKANSKVLARLKLALLFSLLGLILSMIYIVPNGSAMPLVICTTLTILFSLAIPLQVALFVVKVHLIELMVIAMACSCSVATIILLLKQKWSLDGTGQFDFIIIAVCCASAVFFVFGSSVWGLSAAKRLNETRTWHRLGLMSAGWSFIAGIPVILKAVYLTGVISHNQGPVGSAVIVYWILASLLLPAILVEHRIYKKTN